MRDQVSDKEEEEVVLEQVHNEIPSNDFNSKEELVENIAEILL